MSNTTSVIRYSPLGLGGWIFGPIFTLAGALLLFVWRNEILHRVANSRIIVSSISDWFAAATCFSSRCDGFEYAFGATAWIVFFIFAFGIFAVGILFMNVDRSTIVQDGVLLTWRGNFFKWQKESLSHADIASIDVAKVAVFGLIGKRAYKVGDKWRVAAALNVMGIMGKPKRRIFALVVNESEARSIASQLTIA